MEPMSRCFSRIGAQWSDAARDARLVARSMRLLHAARSIIGAVDETPQPQTPDSPRWIRFSLALAVSALGTIFVLLCVPPSQRAKLPSNASERGEAFEHALAAAVTKIRPVGNEWAIAIDPADINAWLATRLIKWIDHDPSLEHLRPLTEVRLASVSGALQVESPYGPFIASICFTPVIEGERLAVHVARPRIGRVPLWGVASEEVERLRAHLALSEPHARAQLLLADGRRVELREIVCEAGRIVLLFATVAAGE